jgi:hypothetical protein
MHVNVTQRRKLANIITAHTHHVALVQNRKRQLSTNFTGVFTWPQTYGVRSAASVQAHAARSVRRQGTASVHKRLLSARPFLNDDDKRTAVFVISARNRRVSSSDTNENGKLSVRRYGGATGVHVRPSMARVLGTFWIAPNSQTFTVDLVEQQNRKQWLVTIYL